MVIQTLQWVQDAEEVQASSGQLSKWEGDQAPGKVKQNAYSQKGTHAVHGSIAFSLSKNDLTNIERNIIQQAIDDLQSPWKENFQFVWNFVLLTDGCLLIQCVCNGNEILSRDGKILQVHKILFKKAKLDNPL